MQSICFPSIFFSFHINPHTHSRSRFDNVLIRDTFFSLAHIVQTLDAIFVRAIIGIFFLRHFSAVLDVFRYLLLIVVLHTADSVVNF